MSKEIVIKSGAVWRRNDRKHCQWPACWCSFFGDLVNIDKVSKRRQEVVISPCAQHMMDPHETIDLDDLLVFYDEEASSFN